MLWILPVLLLLTALGASQAQAATCNCNNLASFKNCLSSAQCGDEIALAAGTYTDFAGVIIKKDCPTDKKLTVRGAQATGTTLSGNATRLVLEGNGIVVKWLHIRGKNSGGLDGAVQFKGARFYRFTENTFKNSDGLSTALVLGKFDANTRDTEDIEIDHNVFENLTLGYMIRIYAAEGGAVSGGHTRRVNVHHNTFRNLTDKGGSDSLFEMGRSGGASGDLEIDTIYAHNLFDRVTGHWGTFHPKVSNLTVQYNTFINSYGFILRHGKNHKFLDNYYEINDPSIIPKAGNGGVFAVNNVGVTIARNVVKCTSALCKYIVSCSYGTGDVTSEHSPHYETCRDLVIEDNTFHHSSQAVIYLGTFRGASSNDGPRLDPPHDITIRRNHLVGSSGVLLNKHAEVKRGLIIADNHFYPTGSATIGIQGVGASQGDPNYISTTTGAAGAFQAKHITASTRGALRAPVLDSCIVNDAQPNVNRITWKSSFPPLAVMQGAYLDTSVSGRARTTTDASMSAPLRTDATFDGPAVAAGHAVTLITQQGAVENAQCIGGAPLCMSAINTATTTVRQCAANIEEPPPPSEAVRTQEAGRCAFHTQPGWQGPQNTPCEITPGRQLAIVGEYHVSGASEPAAVGKQLSCCWQGCDLTENFWAVDDAGTHGVKYASTGLIPHGLPVEERLLTGAVCTHVDGVFITRDQMFPQALAPGECSTIGYVIEVMSNVDPEVTPALTCTMTLDDGTPFAAGSVRTRINVRAGQP